MGGKPNADAPNSPEVVGQIILLHPDQIDASDRLRPIDPVWAEALGGVMAAEGQKTSIEVCRLPGQSNYRLVTGGHRHEGARIKGLMLRAEVVTADAAERKLREASENLNRRELSPLDRAAHVAQLVAVHKAHAGVDPAQDGRVASAATRWKFKIKQEAEDASDTMSFVYGWSKKVGEDLGFSARTIERAMLLYRRLKPSVIAALRAKNHPILKNAGQLRLLAKLDDKPENAAQSHMLGLLIHANARYPEAPFASVSKALAAMNGKDVQAEADKRLRKFISAFRALDKGSEKAGALDLLREFLPKGWTLTGPESGQ